MISEPMRIRVWGEWACFTRPEFHVERVSYPVITPSAARGILEAILMKPIEKPEAAKRDRKIGFRWHILRIGIIKEGTMVPILRNELGYPKFSYSGYDILDNRTQRHSLILNDVEYLIEAVIEVHDLVKRIGGIYQIAKYQKMFERRAKDGQCYHRPYLGCREFPCDFEWAPDMEPADISKPYGMMFRDFDFDPIWEFWKENKPRPKKWEKDGKNVTPQPSPFYAIADKGWIRIADIRMNNGKKEVILCDNRPSQSC